MTLVELPTHDRATVIQADLLWGGRRPSTTKWPASQALVRDQRGADLAELGAVADRASSGRVRSKNLAGLDLSVAMTCAPCWSGAEQMGARPVAEGAASVLWAATLPDDGPTGELRRDGRPLPW